MDLLLYHYHNKIRMQCQKYLHFFLKVQDILLFDLDNYIGKAINKKEEIILARKQAEMQAIQNEDAKSFYYPPEEDDEPQELIEIAEQVQQDI